MSSEQIFTKKLIRTHKNHQRATARKAACWPKGQQDASTVADAAIAHICHFAAGFTGARFLCEMLHR